MARQVKTSLKAAIEAALVNTLVKNATETAKDLEVRGKKAAPPVAVRGDWVARSTAAGVKCAQDFDVDEGDDVDEEETASPSVPCYAPEPVMVVREEVSEQPKNGGQGSEGPEEYTTQCNCPACQAVRNGTFDTFFPGPTEQEVESVYITGKPAKEEVPLPSFLPEQKRFSILGLRKDEGTGKLEAFNFSNRVRSALKKTYQTLLHASARVGGSDD